MAKTLPPNGGGPGLVPAQGTRSHTPQLKDPACCKEDQRSQVPQVSPVQPYKYFLKMGKELSSLDYKVDNLQN